MRTKRRIIVLVCAIAMVLTGCFGRKVRSDVTKYDGCAAPVSARFYLGAGRGEATVEELPTEKLPALVEALDGLRYTTHSCHTDYFWAGQYGVELTLADGTFWNYDGTRVEHRKVSIIESMDEQNRISATFTDLEDCSFWDAVRPFFEAAKTISP